MFKNILVPIDPGHGEVVPRILAVARHLAGKDGRITLLTVLEPIPTFVVSQIPEDIITANRAQAQERLNAMARREGLEGQVVLRQGAPSTEILEEAARIGADAIVLGSHRPDYTDFFLGSTAARVVRHARCTVVVERSGAVSP